ncbi:hypothetical protein M3Y99_01710600 [Aphelenchoides fujianensis]|nr:hypothetical protein M3Y99_01710600 [Aphelenchoides fujianensis]
MSGSDAPRAYDREKEYVDDTFKYCGISIHIWSVIFATIILVWAIVSAILSIVAHDYWTLITPVIAIVASVLLIVGNRTLKPPFYYAFLILCLFHLIATIGSGIYLLATGGFGDQQDDDGRHGAILANVFVLLVDVGLTVLTFFIVLLDLFYVRYALEDHLAPGPIYPTAEPHVDVPPIVPEHLHIETPSPHI